MRTGDRVRFRVTSKAWRSRALAPDAQGIVVDIYRTAVKAEIKVDVRFGKEMQIERGINVDELERIPEPRSDRTW
ncbi:MAG: hypothetical protein ACHQAQ_04480 [Hyphomicrobiales bacterium]